MEGVFNLVFLPLNRWEQISLLNVVELRISFLFAFKVYSLLNFKIIARDELIKIVFILELQIMNKYSFQRPEMEIPLQTANYNRSRETLGRYSEYSLHSSYKIRAGDAACKIEII